MINPNENKSIANQPDPTQEYNSSIPPRRIYDSIVYNLLERIVPDDTQRFIREIEQRQPQSNRQRRHRH